MCDGHPTLLQLQLLLSPELITPKDLVLQTQVFISQVMGGGDFPKITICGYL